MPSRRRSAGRVPENSLLSHDLFEGSFARAALCTDIQLVDDYPRHYLTFAARQHRWVRGDWQIARWLWRTVPRRAAAHGPQPLPVIARWKIFDNLRRSLLAPSLVALLVAGMDGPAGSPAALDRAGAAGPRLPAYAQLARSLIQPRPRRAAARALPRPSATTSLAARGRPLLSAGDCCAHQARLMLDAIGRTLWRLLVTRRRPAANG